MRDRSVAELPRLRQRMSVMREPELWRVQLPNSRPASPGPLLSDANEVINSPSRTASQAEPHRNAGDRARHPRLLRAAASTSARTSAFTSAGSVGPLASWHFPRHAAACVYLSVARSLLQEIQRGIDLRIDEPTIGLFAVEPAPNFLQRHRVHLDLLVMHAPAAVYAL